MVLQQGCCAAPMRQSPAIFLQHAISAAVIWEFGRHASAGIASHRASNPKTMTVRHRAITRCYPLPARRCKLPHERLVGQLKSYRLFRRFKFYRTVANRHCTYTSRVPVHA